jgi:hypothetical protein
MLYNLTMSILHEWTNTVFRTRSRFLKFKRLIWASPKWGFVLSRNGLKLHSRNFSCRLLVPNFIQICSVFRRWNILHGRKQLPYYEGDTVNRSQMDIKRKTCVIRTLKNRLFLDISSTNTDTLVPLLYQCIETRSIEVFWLSQPLSHLIGHHLRLSNVLERISRPTCEPPYATNTSHRKQGTFIYEYPLHWAPLPIKNAQQNAALR